MRVGIEGVTTLKRTNTIILIVLLVLGTFVLAAAPDPQEESAPVVPWEDVVWTDYTFRDETIKDWENKPYESDPTHGPASVQPEAVDIASGVDASGGGADYNPGDYASVQYYYYDDTGLSNDYLFLRMRVAGDPRASGGSDALYISYHWDILLNIDEDIYSEFVVDLFGGGGAYKWGTIGVYYSNTLDYEYDPENDAVWTAEASDNENYYTQVNEIDYGTPSTDDDQWWLEFAIPVDDAFEDLEDNQLLDEETDFLLFFSTSASNTNPLQKDWMGEYVFGEPANIVVDKEVLEGTVSPGDLLHYTIHYDNTGEFKASDVWIDDTIPEYTTFVSSTPTYDSVDESTGTYTWHFTDVYPGEHSITMTVEVDLDVPDGTTLTNYVYLEYTDDHGDPMDPSEDWTYNDVEGPYMTFEKVADRDFADPGDTIKYTLTYENIGSGGAYDVVITDVLPAEVDYLYSVPAPTTVDGITLTWDLGVVPGTSTNTIEIFVNVPHDAVDGTYLTNHATLTYTDVNENYYDPLEDWAYVTIRAPIMTLSKTADVTEADPGDTITYTITYQNTGTGDAADVVIVDTIDPDTTLVSADPAPDEISGDTLTWNLGTVPGGDPITITIVVTVDEYIPDTTILTNSVTLNYNDPNGTPFDELTDSVDVTGTAPLMTITKTASTTTANPEDQITYTLSYANTGTGDAANVVIVDTIDPDTTFVSASVTPTSNIGGVITWELGTVAGETSGTITVTVKVNEYVADGTILTNSVVLDYDDPNNNEYPQEDDSVDVTVTAPLFTISKTAGQTTADPGDQITYTISWENLGSGDATDVIIVDTIDSGTTYVSATPTPTSVSSGVITWNLGTVAGGASGTITVIVKVNLDVDDGDILTNTVVLDYEDTNDNPYPQEDDSVDVTVTLPIMTITKTANVGNADPDDEITYTISYENTGTGDATDVTIIDTLDTDTSFESASVTPNSNIDGVLTWYLGTVAGETSGSITVTVSVKVGVADGTILTNGVTLDYDDANGNPHDQESSSVDVTVTAPLMTILKTANVGEADPDDQIIYTIDWENLGSGVATDVTIVDTIDPLTEYYSASPAPTTNIGGVLTWELGDVAGYGSGTITVTVTVNVGVADGTTLTNGVTLDYDDANGNPYEQESSSVDVTVTAPVMSFSKAVCSCTANPGDTLTYTLSYSNTGSGDAGNVVVEDTLPAGVTYQSSSPTYSSKSGSTYTWNLGTVTAGGSGTITITVTVNAGLPDGTKLTNSATLSWEDPNGNPYTPITKTVTTTVTAPIMDITKTVGVSTADPGDTITYTLSWENTGTGQATGVTIVDTIDPDTTFVSANPAESSESGGVITWNLGDVDGLDSGTITVTVTVNVGVADGTILTNDVTLDYDDANGNGYPQETSSVDVTVTAPIMDITKTVGVSTADPGDTITYTLSWENTGTGQATGVTIVDTIDPDTTFVSANPAESSESGGVITWNLGDVDGLESGTITVTVTVNVGVADGTILTNDVTLDYDDANGNGYPQETSSVDVTVTAPIMDILKIANVGNADPGDTITYTLSWENTGTGQATGVTIVDTIDPDTTFLSATPAPDSNINGVLTWNLGSVAGETSGSITVTVTVKGGVADGTVLTNDVTLDYDDANGNGYPQETSTVDVTVTAPIMDILKIANVGNADPSDPITYTISWENTGTGEATGVTIVDTIDPDTTFLSATPGPDSNINGVLTWNLGSVPGLDSGTITVTVTVNVGVADGVTLTNGVTLDYDDANGNPYDQGTSSVDVTVTAPIMDIVKIADVTTADPSDPITYTISWENTGTGEATGVTIVDTIDPDTTFLSAIPAPDSNNNGVLTWNLGSVPGLDSGTITIIVTVNVDVGDEITLTNGVTLDYDDANGNPYDQETSSVDVTVTAPIMTFTKTVNHDTADPSDELIYTLTYNNIGTGVATGVTIIDIIDPDTTFLSASLTPDDSLGDTYTWNIGTVLDGGGGTITITVEVDAFVTDGTNLLNEATLDYNDANGNPYPQLSDDASTIVTAPAMTIIKSADVSKADPGDTITYTIQWWNNGNGDAKNVVITDTLPNYVTFEDADPYPDTVVGRTLTWDLGTVGGNTDGTILIYITVDPGTPDGTLLTNGVLLEYEDDNNNEQDDEDDDAETTVTAPVMTFSKCVCHATADPGDTIQYTLSYSNSGSGDASNVVITDTLPDEVTYVSSNPTHSSVIGKTYKWNIGDVAAGTSGSVVITVTVNVGVPDGTLIENLAIFDYSDDNGNPYDPLDDDADVTVTAPIMTILKTASATEADPSDPITYTIDYDNIGTGDATDIVIVDTIPDHTTYVSATPAPDTNVDGVLTWTFATIIGGAGGTITVEVTVDAYTADATLLTNTVVLDYDDANGNPYPQESDTALTTVTAPDMTIAKVADVTDADPGDTIIYTITYTNLGSGTATDILITDIIDEDTTFVGSNPPADSSSFDTYNWINIINVGPYGSGTITVTVTVDVGLGDGVILHNSCTLDYDDANGNPYGQETSSADVTVTAPDMTISKDVDVSKADPSDEITYTIDYENLGSGEATDIVIIDIIPMYTTLVSASPTADSEVGRVLTWNIASLAGYGDGTITVVVSVNPYTANGELLTNTATLDYDDANGNPLSQVEDSAQTTVTAPVLYFSKNADVSVADPSDTIVYTLYWCNSGDGEATDVVVTDILPDDVDFVSSDPTPDDVTGTTYTWNIGSVPAKTSGTITITVTVKPGTNDGELLHNIARFNYDDANGNPYTEIERTADVTVTAPILSILKTASVEFADPEDQITYTIEFTNSGTGDATEVWIKDTLPDYTTYVSSSPTYDDLVDRTYMWYYATVAASETVTITLVVEVDVGTPDETVLPNGVTLDYNDDNGNPLDQETSSDDVTVTAPIFTFSKIASVTEADPGDTIIYTIEYENIGTGWATLVKILDTIPEDTSFVSATAGYSELEDKYTWTIGDVAPGASGTITIEVTVDVPTPDETLLHNTAKLDYADANGNYYGPMCDYADVDVTAPMLSITKDANVDDADPGDTIIYTIDYANSGTGWATLVEITDTIPGATTYVTSTPGYTSVSVDDYKYWIGDLAPGASGTITIEVTVDVATADKALLHNVAVLEWADANGNYYPQLDDFADVDVTAPVMTFSKTASVTEADPGDTIIYTINYKNWGTGWATLVEIVDTIPDHVTVVDATAGYAVSGNDYTWTIGDLGPGQYGTITIEVTVDLQTTDQTLLHNYATLDYADANGNYYPFKDGYANVDVTSPILSLSKVASVSTADPGDTIIYTIEYDNSGTGWATLVKIVDTIPDHVTVVDATAGYSLSGNEYTWYIGDLGPGASGTITIEVTVDVPTDDDTLLYNKATLDWADANGNYYDHLLAYANTVVTAPILTLTKTVDVDYADPDDTVTYTIEYTNIGTGWASLVEILDTIPADTTFVSATGSYTKVDDDITWAIGDLEPSGTGTITVVVKVDIQTDDETILHNEAWLDWADANGNYYTQLYDYADTVVTAPIMTFSKSTPDGTADPGDVLVYTLTYENLGTGWATEVSIDDNIPIAHVTLIGASPMWNGVSGGIYTWDIGDVAPGGSGSISVSVKVDVGVADETLLHNGGTLYWADANGNFYTPLTDFANVFVTAPILSMTKTADVEDADPGDTIIYTIEYTNHGTGWASLVEIVDTIPEDTTYVSSTPAPSDVVDDTYTWTIGDVAPDATLTVTVEVTVDVPTPDETLLYNEATLDWADANGNYYTQLWDDEEVYVTAPVLSFSKIANTTTAYPLGPIVYTLEYENSGTGWATGVVIVDTISLDTDFVSATPSETSSTGNEYTWVIGDLGPGASGQIEITVAVKDETPDKTELENFATLDWADANGNYYPQLDGYALVTVTAPIIILDKTADKTTVNPGDLLVYTINYKNIGTGSLWGFEIQDTIPPFMTFVDADPWYTSVSENTYTWFIGRVDPGTDEDILLTVQIDAFTPDQQVITNEIGDVSSEVTVTAPIMDITKTADVDEADPGDLIEYTITYENTGTGNATGVLITDVIPVGTSFVSSSIPYTDFLGNTYKYFIDFVLAGSYHELTITVMVIPGTADQTVLLNEVFLDYADANGNFYPQEYDFAEVVVTAPVMVMSKEASVEDGTPGDPITYTIDYENLGTGDASSVTVIDILPLDVTYVSATPAPDSIVGNVLTWNIDDVASGGFGTITIEVYITPGTWDETILHNVATLDYSDANDNHIEQLSDDADVIVIAPVMTLDKVGGDVSEEAYLVTDVRLRVAGEKWHDVKMWLFKGEEQVGFVEIMREPGDPDDQSKTIEGVTIDMMTDTYSALVQYTPFDDAINGQWWGADPAWIIFETESGKEVRLHHTFNVRHPDTWNWTVDDFRPYLINLPLTLKYTISYTIDYANIGTGDATDVWIYDVIPAGTFLEYASLAPDTIVGDIVGWEIGYVASGESGSIYVDVAFEFPDVIVKNWYPEGKFLYNNVTMDYHDTNGNLVDQPCASAATKVYVPSELKKPKTGMYAPVFQGEGSETPEGLIPQVGYSQSELIGKYIAVYEEMSIGQNLGPSGAISIAEQEPTYGSAAIYVYMGKDPYANEPIADFTEIEETPVEVEPILPPSITPLDLPSVELVPVEIISMEYTLEEEIPELPPEIIEIQPLVIPEVVVISEPQEVQVHTTEVVSKAVSKVSVVEETVEPDVETVKQAKVGMMEEEVVVKVDKETKEESSSEDIHSHDIAYTEAVLETVSKAYISSVNINMAIIWFTVLAMIIGLLVECEIRKRR